MANGHTKDIFRGASGGILPANANDIPLDYGSKINDAGCFLGSAAVVVLSNMIIERCTLFTKFFEEESCGQCTLCRSGTRNCKINARKKLEQGKLKDLSEVMAQASICGLGQVAANPLNSVLKYLEIEITYD